MLTNVPWVDVGLDQCVSTQQHDLHSSAKLSSGEGRHEPDSVQHEIRLDFLCAGWECGMERARMKTPHAMLKATTMLRPIVPAGRSCPELTAQVRD